MLGLRDPAPLPLTRGLGGVGGGRPLLAASRKQACLEPKIAQLLGAERRPSPGIVLLLGEKVRSEDGELFRGADGGVLLATAGAEAQEAGNLLTTERRLREP